MIISESVKKLRTDWAISDGKRDEGLTTPENITRYDDISYGPYGQWNLLDIYHKKDVTKPQPAIVNVHGGAWVYGTKELYQYYCMSLAQRGFTVISFNYRLAPESKYPSHLEDINRALSFIKENGEKYFIDTENVFMVGDSAGAQLTSHYMTIYSNPEFAKLFDFSVPDIQIRAVALNCGLYDIRKSIENNLEERMLDYIGEDQIRNSVVLESLDTIGYMTKDFPPSYVMSAQNDFLVHCAEPMYEHLKSLGVDCKLKIYGTKEQDEINHIFHVNIKLEEAGICNDNQCEFFRKYISN